MIRRTFAVPVLVLGILVAFATTAQSQIGPVQQLGPGAAFPGATTPDTGGTGGRTNIDQISTLTLAPGTYEVLNFQYNAVTSSGTVQAFIATTANAGVNYTPIWVGPTTGTVGTGIKTQTLGGPSQTFTLGSTTTVFAGFAMSDNVIGTNTGGGSTDHNAPMITPVLNNLMPAFNNQNLGRTYGFQINLASTPEPASILVWSLLGVAGLGFVWWRRRKTGQS